MIHFRISLKLKPEMGHFRISHSKFKIFARSHSTDSEIIQFHASPEAQKRPISREK
jgi:hypothetical protein